MPAGKITERRAAVAARQLAYHRRRIRWMEERIEVNAAALEAYLIAEGKEAAGLPGGYVVEATETGEIVVAEPEAGAGYEQLVLLEPVVMSAVCRYR